MKTRFFSALALLICLAFTTLSYAQNTTRDTIITIRVSGIDCPLCPPNICARVKKENGVKNCVLIGKPTAVSTFKITYNPTITTYSKVVAAVQSTPSCEDPDEKPFTVKQGK